MTDVVFKGVGAERPFEEIAVEWRDRIQTTYGKADGLRFMEMANGILVLYPKGLRETVLVLYGNVMYSQGRTVADDFIERLRQLFLTERSTGARTREVIGRAGSLTRTWIPPLLRKPVGMLLSGVQKKKVQELFTSS